MFSARRFISLTLLGVPAAMALLGASGAMAACRHNDDRCQRGAYWDLHRPSTPAERAETSQLNSEYRQTIAAAPMPYYGDGYQREQQRYDRELRAYQAAQQRYVQEMHGPGPRPYYGAYGPPGRAPGRQAYALRMRHHPMTAEELDNDPFAPTGGAADDGMAAPTPGLDGSTTGITQFNLRASGVVPSHPYRDPYYPPPPRYPY